MLFINSITNLFSNQQFKCEFYEYDDETNSKIFRVESMQETRAVRCPLCDGKVHIQGNPTIKLRDMPVEPGTPLKLRVRFHRYEVTGKPPVPLQTKNKRKRGTSCENSSFFVFCISTRPASLLARLFHLGNPLFAFFRKLLRPWKQVLQEIQIRIIHVFRNLGQQMRNVVRGWCRLISSSSFQCRTAE